MFRNTIIMLLAVASLAACSQSPARDNASSLYDSKPMLTSSQKQFMQNLASLCGNSYQGRQAYMQPGRESWEDRSFVMHVTVCNADSILIPFHLDEDRSRTWVFAIEDQGLRFRHDHRYEDGTPHRVTLYGGYADNEKGTAFQQFFPADEYTCVNFPHSCEATWTVELAEDMSLFSYRLFSRTGELIFQADFELN